MTASSKHDSGFTMIEMLVVLLLIAILSAIAFVTVDNQRQKGQDSSAKSDATNLVRFVESCYVQTDDYRDCQTSDLSGTGLPLGNGPGQVEVTSGAPDEFIITAASRSGGHFRIETAPTYHLRRTCDHVSSGCRSADAAGNEW